MATPTPAAPVRRPRDKGHSKSRSWCTVVCRPQVLAVGGARCACSECVSLGTAPRPSWLSWLSWLLWGRCIFSFDAYTPCSHARRCHAHLATFQVGRLAFSMTSKPPSLLPRFLLARRLRTGYLPRRPRQRPCPRSTPPAKYLYKCPR
ncbi:hypothetical protein HBI56_070680 [Parastagonospora nodorum]|nr:hypothetical protein HBH56_005110 [Parastagonospora nodorum]KAH3937930.1 hypothetical protein HBH54_005100 [Parastagonospora nodorum]KAH3946673.1 hypothetical protein HBH53_126860 [Parastagonospora nodorum]KAH3974998.1 hypothetical protein HBH51_087860 [Parastagonospora nodorum]KAH3978387.1 hypothetical protein HBH52_104890 [Parastagonospora nodorum]